MLVQQPSSYSAALSPVLITLHNMMHLINLARHHQVSDRQGTGGQQGRRGGAACAQCWSALPWLLGLCLCCTLPHDGSFPCVMQARETLKLALQTQIQQKQAALDQLKQQAADAKAKLLAINQKLADVGGDVAESAPRQKQQATTAAPMEEG